jgi:hypothetical protein
VQFGGSPGQHPFSPRVGKADPEARSAPTREVVKGRLVTFTELAGDIKAQSGTVGTGRKKRFKDLLQVVGGDAVAIVADLEKRPLRAVTDTGLEIYDRLTVRWLGSIFI